MLLWQGRLRVLIASTAAVAELLLLISEGAGGSPIVPFVLGATIVYLLLAVATATLAKRGRVADWLIPAAACADVALVFGVTVATISGTVDAPVFTSTSGRTLSEADTAALIGIFSKAVDVATDLGDAVYRPAMIVFN